MSPWISPEFLTLVLLAPFVGSFLAVLVVRLPQEEDVVVSRSRCRTCGHALGFADLVPVLSWVFSGGKCRHCGAQISTLYPGMELAAIVVVMWGAMSVAPEALVLTVLLGWTLLALAVMDARSLFLSDALTLPLIPLGLVVITALDPGGMWDSIAGVVVGAAMMSALAWAYLRYRHREGLGLGDVKLAAAAGAWVGLQGLGTVILWAVMVNAAMLAIVALKGERMTAETRVPLGTGLAAGLWLTWLYGPVSIA